MGSSAEPSSPAILLLDLPKSLFCGIDLLSFTTSPKFHGIKDLTPGFHFIFTSETSSLSIRDGFWFHVPESSKGLSHLTVRVWDGHQNLLQNVKSSEEYRRELQDHWIQGLSPYRQTAKQDEVIEDSSNTWRDLTRHITSASLRHLTGDNKTPAEWRITSASCAKVDEDAIPGLDAEEIRSVLGGEEKELGVLGIDLRKTWPANAVGRERTEAAMDASWALGDTVKRWRAGESASLFEDQAREWGSIVLAQMEACFIMVLTLANYSCLEEWKRCVGLSLKCKQAIRDHPGYFASFLHLLRKQLERCEDVDEGLFDMTEGNGNMLKGWLKVFRSSVAECSGESTKAVRSELDALEEFLKTTFGWELDTGSMLKQGTIELEDGERVEMDLGTTFDEEDESGEYRPVVVDLDGGQ